MNADNWPDRLLAGMQGQLCRDADTGVDGVWLPRRAWDNLASIARGSPMAHGYALGAQHAQAAARHMSDRAATYDAPQGERSMARTVTAFNALTGQHISEAEGWLLLQLLKDARQWQRPDYHADSAEDCIAYAALKAEALAREG